MAWGRTTTEEAEYWKRLEVPPPEIGWAASCLAPILRCRAAIGKPVHLLERLVGHEEDPSDSRLYDRIWQQYLCEGYNFRQYLK